MPEFAEEMPAPKAHIFVLRVPGAHSAAELEYVNSAITSQHGTLSDALTEIKIQLARTVPSQRH